MSIYRPAEIAPGITEYVIHVPAPYADMEDCIESIRRPTARGYIWLTAEKQALHRKVFAAFYGTSAEDMEDRVIMHLCDNKACINPAHLQLGTHQENTHDMMRKGRNKFMPPVLFGEANGRAVLTTALATEIKAKYETGKFRLKDLAKRYSVSTATVHRVVRGTNWK